MISLDDGASPKVRDWQAYAWNSGGSASVVLKDNNDTQTRAKVAQLLAELATYPADTRAGC